MPIGLLGLVYPQVFRYGVPGEDLEMGQGGSSLEQLREENPKSLVYWKPG